MDKIKIQVLAEECPPMESEVFDVEPVDVMGGFVPMDKEASDNLAKTQANIRYRFSMESRHCK